ncbi:MAG: hypothetical protein K0Q59_267 [Paenibacillus sp.]|jgi:two-component system sensor histidine kinase ComP|nr:hypothetical protein [Paenibacillus sp.]
MRELSRKNLRAVAIVLIVALAMMQSWFIYLHVHYPYLGINAAKDGGNGWVVESFDADGAHGYIDLRLHDRILAINGIPAEDYTILTKWKSVEQASTIEIERDQQRITVTTENARNRVKLTVLPFVAVVVSFLVAILLLRNIRNSRSAQLLSYVFMSVGVTFMSLSASIRGDALGKIVISCFIMLIPLLFLHFLIVFFKEKGGKRLPKRMLRYLYSIVIVTFAMRLSYFFESPLVDRVYQINSITSIMFFLMCIAIVFGLLIRIFVQHRNENSSISVMIRFIWVSLLLSFSPVVLLSFLPRVLTGTELISSLYTGWVVLIFPLSFAYLMLTKQLYDIHIVLRRIFFTVILAIVPSSLLAVINLSMYGHVIDLKYGIFSFLVVLIVFSFVLYSIEHLYTRLERFMFPRKHVLQVALKRISKDLTSIASFRDLKELILVDIVNTLQVYGGAIVFKYRASKEIIRSGSIDEAEVEALVERDAELEHPELLCFEINRHEEYTSYLIITRKKSNTRLELEEVQWLSLITSYLAVSLENIHLIRKLTDKLNRLASQLSGEQDAQDFNWFRKLTFELQERERVRIATDLHDTTMQDLFFLKRKLASLCDKYQLTGEAKANLMGLVEYIEIININLRQNCFDLHPYLLQEIGLVRTIEKIVERESFSSPFQIRFDAAGAQAIERKDLEIKRHLFRIVQELLNNAKKHSEATFVSIRLSAANGVFMLHYRDDGVGFDPERIAAAPNMGSSGVGMEQLRSRILHLQGKLELDAAPGMGVELRISFPMKEGMSA